MRTNHILAALAFMGVAHWAGAETVLLDENFDEDYNKSFPFVLDADDLTPHSSIYNLFYSNSAGRTMPWWICKDSNESTDRFIASHSYYRNPGKSNDWLISIPLDIDGEGYVLEFDAQSVNVRGTDYISDLALFVTDRLLSPADIPTEPTHVWHAVPYGDDIDACEGDWTHYSYSLDAYAGQIIYVNFVNVNEDKDIICLDNVKVWRHEPVNITLDYEPYVSGTSTDVSAAVEVTDPAGITDWTLEMLHADEVVASWRGDFLEAGSLTHYPAKVPLDMGSSSHFEYVLSSKDNPRIKAQGDVMGMAFVPTHRVFVEETTSLHCGNCPMGTYAIECLLHDADYGSSFIPVSVHIAGLGYDPMATQPYYSALPESNAAPVVFVERDPVKDGFNNIDANYDPSNYYTFANRMIRRMARHTPIDIDLDASWVIEGADTTAVVCKAIVKAAYNLDKRNYRVAFILTENNVGLDNNAYWLQENYSSGKDYVSRCGGWCDLPKIVPNARYHDVARAISHYDGHPNSLPAHFVANQEYTFDYKMEIPDTYSENKGYMLSAPIQRQFCQLTAIVIDADNGTVLNAARLPLSPVANQRCSLDYLVEQLGVSDVSVDSDSAPTQYFDLLGRPVANPTSGFYISRGGKVVKFLSF